MSVSPLRLLLTDILKALLSLPLVIVLAFLLIRSLGDPTEIIMEEAVDQRAIQAMREYLGLDRSMTDQLLQRIADVLRLQFGNSFIDQQPVIDILSARMGNSGLIMLASILFLIVLCPLLGALAYRFDRRMIVSTLLFSSLFAVPPLIVAVLVFYPAVSHLGLQIFEPTLSWLKVLLAGFCIALPYVGFLARIVAEALREEMGRTYVRFAKMTGLTDRAILLRHVARNALIRVLATANVIVIGFFTGSLVVERIFNIRGVGYLIVEAAIGRDYIVLEGIVIVVFVFLAVLNSLLRAAFQAIDPRYAG